MKRTSVMETELIAELMVSTLNWWRARQEPLEKKTSIAEPLFRSSVARPTSSSTILISSPGFTTTPEKLKFVCLSHLLIDVTLETQISGKLVDSTRYRIFMLAFVWKFTSCHKTRKLQSNPTLYLSAFEIFRRLKNVYACHETKLLASQLVTYLAMNIWRD